MRKNRFRVGGRLFSKGFQVGVTQEREGDGVLT